MKLSESNSVTVRFHTDESDTDKGFKYSWWEVDDGSEGPTTTTTVKPEAKERFCGGMATDMDCCDSSEVGKCGYGEGDCDADVECAAHLR